MPEAIPIVAQYAMDQFYQNYRGGTDFFELKDFVFHCGVTIAAAFQQEYEAKRAELRQEGREEVVSFSHNWLLEEILAVKQENHETFAEMSCRIMAFPYDKQDTALQELFSIEPWGTILERSNITEIWQQRYYPQTDRVFWYVDRNKIKFYNKGDCNVKKVRMLYVPAISDKMLVPDGIIDYAITATVTKMKQIAQGVVVKKSLDQNDNKILQTEIDMSQLKQ